MLKNILVYFCHCLYGCLRMLVCASQLIRWQIVNVYTSAWLVNIIYLTVAGVRQNVEFMCIYPFCIPLINFSCQNILEFSFCQIQCGSLKIRRKSTFTLLHNQRGGVWLHKRYPLSGLRVAPLFLGIQGAQRCYGSLPDNVIFKVDKMDSQNTLGSECYSLFSIGKKLYPQRASPPMSMHNCSQVPMPLTQS